MILTSAYFPGEEESAATEELMILVRHCRSQNMNSVIGCNQNTDHTAWDSTYLNKRGEPLLDFIFCEYLEGNMPNLVTVNRAEGFLDRRIGKNIFPRRQGGFLIRQR